MSSLYSDSYIQLFVYLILAAALQAGCSTAPVQEMSDARQSIQAARVASNLITAGSNLQVAEGLLQRAKLAMEEGDYGLAKRNATEARAIAVSVQQKVPLGGVLQ